MPAFLVKRKDLLGGEGMLTIAIVEDDLKSVQLLRKYIEQYGIDRKEQIKVQHYTNGLNFISECRMDCNIVLMDIEMPYLNGLETAKKLRMLDSHIPLIFITNMAQYAINGYEVQALDFMVKPVEYFNFSIKLDRAVRICRENVTSYIYVQTDLGVRKINTAELIYVESEKHYLFLHTQTECYKVRSTMKSFISRLPVEKFACCSKSYCVNMDYVTKFDSKSICVDQMEISISRNYKKEFIDQMTTFINRGGN